MVTPEDVFRALVLRAIAWLVTQVLRKYGRKCYQYIKRWLQGQAAKHKPR